jgi:hypothetical protein
MKTLCAAAIACATAFLFPEYAMADDAYEKTPEWGLVVHLEAESARCAIDGRMLQIEMRKQGESADIDAAFRKSRACVDEALPKVRELYRATVQAVPGSKPVLAKAYASWMTYMDTLGVPMETDEQSAAKAAFEAAVSEIRAELDAR